MKLVKHAPGCCFFWIPVMVDIRFQVRSDHRKKRKMKKTWTYKSYVFATHHSKIQCGKPKNEPPATLPYIAINQWHRPSKIRASWQVYHLRPWEVASWQDGHVDPPSLYPWPCFVSPAKTAGEYRPEWIVLSYDQQWRGHTKKGYMETSNLPNAVAQWLHPERSIDVWILPSLIPSWFKSHRWFLYHWAVFKIRF